MRIRVVLVLVVLALLALPAATGSAAVMCNGVPATIWGDAGPNTLHGTDHDDVIAGLGGDDTIYGYPGDDIICGGDGNDSILAGEGTNRVWGDAGNDVISGGSNFDTFFGGTGNDVLDPGVGVMSRLYGQAGNDRILLRQVRAGDDPLVEGGAGRDILDLRNVGAAGLGGYHGVGVFLGSPGYVLPIDCGWTLVGGAIACSTFVGPTGSVSGIEVVYGSAGNDRIMGDGGANLLRGSGRGRPDRGRGR